MRPVVINYVPTNLSYVAPDQTLSVNQPMVLNYNNGDYNLNRGTQRKYVDLPPGQSRQLIFYNTSGAGQIYVFQIVGANFWNETIYETLEYVAGDTFPTTANAYTKVYSITPSQTPGGVTCEVGFSDNGFTNPYPLDIYNKNSSYTFSITNPMGNDPSFPLFLAYTNLDVNIEQNGQIVPNPDLFIEINPDGFPDTSMAYWTPFPLNNENIIISTGITPTPTTYPITIPEGQSLFISTINIPMTAVIAFPEYVGEVPTTASFEFVFTILQQGGKF